MGATNHAISQNNHEFIIEEHNSFAFKGLHFIIWRQ